jgi:hypothetical protein
MAILLSLFQNVACVLFTQANDWCNNERKRKGKRIAKSLRLDQDLNPVSTFHSKKALGGGFTQ